MNLYRSAAKIGGLFILLLALSFAPIACKYGGCTFVPYEPTIDIRIHNQTDETLQIFVDGEVLLGKAFAGGEVVWEIGRSYPDYNITAKDMDGNTVYVVTWTRDDLKGKETYDVYLPPNGKGVEHSDNFTGK